MRWQRRLAISASIVVLGMQSVQADTLWIGDSMKDAIKVDGLKVQDAKGSALGYVTDQGMVASKPFAKLQEINVDGETSFNTAEDAFATRDFDTAISSYQGVLQSSSKTWIQSRAATRLIAAAKVKNRYDAEVTAYVALLQKDPATAAANKPSEPAEHSQYLDSALGSVAKGFDNSKLDSAQKSTLLNLQLQINQTKGDTAAVQSTLKQLVALGGGTDEMKATLKLADANVSYQSKQYPQAINDIEQNKALFTDPDQQVDALFVVAQAKFAIDGEKSDPEVLKDLALNYMRVVTFGGKSADRPHVAESLYQAAAVEEKLREPAAALQLYNQLARDRAYASSPFQAKAGAAITRLSSSGAVKPG